MLYNYQLFLNKFDILNHMAHISLLLYFRNILKDIILYNQIKIRNNCQHRHCIPTSKSKLCIQFNKLYKFLFFNLRITLLDNLNYRYYLISKRNLYYKRYNIIMIDNLCIYLDKANIYFSQNLRRNLQDIFVNKYFKIKMFLNYIRMIDLLYYIQNLFYIRYTMKMMNILSNYL